MLAKLLIACCLAKAIFAQSSDRVRLNEQFLSEQQSKVPTIASGPRVTADTFQPLPFPIPCLNESLACCLRSLVADQGVQQHLDFLDSPVFDNVFNSPEACSTKIDVFMVSTGIDATHDAFRGIRVIVEPDCVDTSVFGNWTPSVDVDGGGTVLAGSIAAPYGVTLNAIIHSIKVCEFWDTSTVASNLCGISQIASWLRDNPCKRAMVVIDTMLFMNQTDSSVVSINDAISALVSEFGDRMIVLTLFTNLARTIDPENLSVLPEVLAVGGLFINNPTGLLQVYRSSGTLSVDVYALAGDNILVPLPGNTVGTVSLFENEVGFTTGILLEYWLTHPGLTGDQLRRIIQDNADSDIHTSNKVIVKSALLPNKVMQFTCNGGCEPCKNGGQFLSNLCVCPPEATGVRCETLLCSDQCSYGHPTYCDRFVTCAGGSPVSAKCGTKDGIQLNFDVLSRTCKLPCEAQTRPGCDFGHC